MTRTKGALGKIGNKTYNKHKAIDHFKKMVKNHKEASKSRLQINKKSIYRLKHFKGGGKK